MANLVPIHVDKDTGRLVARGAGAAGGLGSDFNFAFGYLYEQFTPSDTWAINHDKENDRVIVQVYDSAGEFVLPDAISIIDINNIEITFTAPMEGTAHILFFLSR